MDLEYQKAAIGITTAFLGSEKISKNLMTYYNDLAKHSNSVFDLSNLEVNKMRLYFGDIGVVSGNHDIVVPTEDMDIILEQKGEKDWDGETMFSLNPFKTNHIKIKEQEEIKNKIRKDLR